MNAARTSPAVAALGAILVVTAAWWALALWPMHASTPRWMLEAREMCFGVRRNELPDAGGWVLLAGQPLGMLIVLVAVWPAELAAGLRRMVSTLAGCASTLHSEASEAAVTCAIMKPLFRPARLDRKGGSPSFRSGWTRRSMRRSAITARLVIAMASTSSAIATACP